MPFTFSHPAAVLPAQYFFRRYLSITGLIAGSLVPDFEYFLRDLHHSVYSHTWGGLFYIDLPGGLLLCFLYHNLVRDPLYANVPYTLKKRMAAFQSLNWNRWYAKKWGIVLFSILLGALSHLIWDKLTHHTVPLVKSATGIKNFNSPEDRDLTYFLFWDINSLLGGFLMLYSIWRLPAARRVLPNRNGKAYWLFLTGSASLLVLLQLLQPDTFELANFVIAIINALLASIVLTSAVFGFRLRKKRLKPVPLAKKEGNVNVALREKE